MPTIYHVTEWWKPFVALTNPPAIQNVASRLGYDCIIYNYPEFASRQIEKDSSNDAVFIFEAAYPQMANFTTKEIRKYFPNAKLVCLGGDTIWFIRNNKHHIDSPYEVDLWLDLMEEVVVFYNNIGIQSDLWSWTVSESILKEFPEYVNNEPVDFDKKDIDFISLIAMSTQYRQIMRNYFLSKEYKFVFGQGCEANNTVDMIDKYRRSWFHLGTTSPSWTTGIRTMKGFRDWIAPALNTLLIYDDHPQIKKRYGGDYIVPTYPYYNFDSLDNLMKILVNDLDLYQHLINLQKEWIRYNTLEKQFTRKLLAYNILKDNTKNEDLPTVQTAEV